jgi:hypothetical protein
MNKKIVTEGEFKLPAFGEERTFEMAGLDKNIKE